MTTNVSDVSNSSSLQCTSCTAKELATSRCCTCHNLLCANCETAHRFMRCFESHKVVSLEELRRNGKKITVHKPLVCEFHPNESVNYYCNTCSVPACVECTKTEHKITNGHQVEGILDSESRVRQEFQGLLTESKGKIEQMFKTSTELQNSLEELENQRSTAKDLINESYQSYKAILERLKDESLKKLSELYHERQLKIMDMTDRVDKEISLMEDACKFANKLLENGTVAEIMYLRKVVGTQLLNLISNAPKVEKTYSVEFLTDLSDFEESAKKTFGSFKTEDAGTRLENNPLSVAVTLAQLTLNGPHNGSLSNSSPISLPASVQSSFDGELGNNIQNLSLAQSPPVPQINTLQGYSSMAEYNIAQLASLAESSASAATSPTPPFLSDLFNTDTAYKNLQSLAKLGLNATGKLNFIYQKVQADVFFTFGY